MINSLLIVRFFFVKAVPGASTPDCTVFLLNDIQLDQKKVISLRKSKIKGSLRFLKNILGRTLFEKKYIGS